MSEHFAADTATLHEDLCWTDEPRVADTATLQEVLLPFDSESLLELSLSEHMEEGTPTAADDKSSDSDPLESEGEGDEDSGMCDRCRGPLCKGFVVAAGLENMKRQDLHVDGPPNCLRSPHETSGSLNRTTQLSGSCREQGWGGVGDTS